MTRTIIYESKQKLVQAYKPLILGKRKVWLEVDEPALAQIVGQRRNDRAEADGRDSNYRGLEAEMEGNISQYELHRNGFAGELAAAKGLNVYPAGIGQDYHDDTDIGVAEVRCRTQHDYELYLWEHRRSKEDVRWILVTGEFPGPYILHGWIWESEGRQDKYWREAHPKFPKKACYVIPTAELHKMDTFEVQRSPRVGKWL